MHFPKRTSIFMREYLFKTLTCFFPMRKQLPCHLGAGVAQMLFDVLLKDYFVAFSTMPERRLNVCNLISG